MGKSRYLFKKIGDIKGTCVLTQLYATLQHYGLRPPGSPVHGTVQARILEWIAISSSRVSSQPKDQTQVSGVYLYWQANSLPLHHLGSLLLSIYK